jgi:hypothetical protein
VFSGASPEAPRCAITQGFRMEVAIVPEAVSSLADREEVSCRESNRKTYDRDRTITHRFASLTPPIESSSQ